MKPHNPTRTPAAPACQPDVVRGAARENDPSIVVPRWVACWALQGIHRMVLIANRRMLNDERPWTQEDEDQRESMLDAQDFLGDLLLGIIPRNTSCVCAHSSAAQSKHPSTPDGDA